ncbi:MAG: hypothetical protein N0C90_22815, partial [Candidatus Thiodiazotropha endolucinida]|nr:hypothetical protein [Candidatus Thiodiazotropha taylori]MCW4264186.1 hypothetical protein [Candidatus Thiodiazotropha endolucinida]
FDELRDLISSSKFSSQSVADQSAMADISTQKTGQGQGVLRSLELDMTVLRDTIASLQTDVMALKQDNGSMFEELKSLKTELKSFKSNVGANINSLKDTLAVCEQSIERISNERCNGIASVKSDIRQFRTDFTSANETFDIRYSDLEKKISVLT